MELLLASELSARPPADGNRPLSDISEQPVRLLPSIVGTRSRGGTLTLLVMNAIAGTTTLLNGNIPKNLFYSDGEFAFVGLLESTMYGCKTSLFNDKRGRFELSGSELAPTPSKKY